MTTFVSGFIPSAWHKGRTQRERT